MANLASVRHAALLLSFAVPVGAQSLTVPTDAGVVVGTVDAGVASFKGIPFAAPPVGPLRWRAPQAPIPWTTPLAASDFGPSCWQALPIAGVPQGTRAATVSEDCLTLNIWAPATHTHPLPVMIWIHGGANIEGGAARTLYDGSHFAHDSVILVSFNYRLGRFGFFAHPALTRDAGAEPTANFALLDQLTAIHWVRRNIAAFGGDTSSITLVGESSGGQDIVILLAANALRGQITRAIVESPGNGWDTPPPLANAEQQDAAIATSLGVPAATATATALRAIPAATVAENADLGETWPILDGKLIREAPLAAFANGHAAAIPLIIGSNSDDGSLIGTLSDPGVIFPRLRDTSALNLIRQAYGPSIDNATFTRLLFRDGHFAGPARWIAAHAATRAPTYLYRFDYVVTPFRATRPGATHGSEIPYIFENWPIPLRIPADIAMDHVMHQCWIAFARTGAPTCDGLPGWTRYDPTTGALMLINDAPGMHDNPVARILDLLEGWLRR